MKLVLYKTPANITAASVQQPPQSTLLIFCLFCHARDKGLPVIWLLGSQRRSCGWWTFGDWEQRTQVRCTRNNTDGQHFNLHATNVTALRDTIVQAEWIPVAIAATRLCMFTETTQSQGICHVVLIGRFRGKSVWWTPPDMKTFAAEDM